MSAKHLEAVIRASPVDVVAGRYAVASVSAVKRPESAFLVCRDQDETTIIVREDKMPIASAIAIEKWFRLLAIRVSAPFGAPGFIATITSAVAKYEINIFIVSTFSKDYALLRESDFVGGCEALKELGFRFRPASPSPPPPAGEDV